MNKKRRSPRPAAFSRPRFALMALLLLAASGAVVARLVNLQVLERGAYEERLRRQREGSVIIPSRRGVIYDRGGEVLAVSVETVSLYAVPEKVDDPKRRARELAEIFNKPASIYREKLEAAGGKSRLFAWVERKIEPDTWKKLQDMGFGGDTGFGVLREYRRRYPKRELAGHVLGRVDIDEVGRAGVEYSQNAALEGRPERLMAVRQANGQVAFLPPAYYEEEATQGSHVMLSLDHVIQHFVERELDRLVAERDPVSASVVVLDPWTGAVLALASRPHADPNMPYESYSEANWRCDAVEHAYEPGSTMKVFVTAAALEEGLVTPSELIFCENGSIEVSRGHRLRDHKPFGTLSVTEIIANSSNVGAVKIARRFPSRQSFHRRLASFGFGRPTGAGLPGESAGLLREPSRWSALSVPALAIGQEVSVSPLQLARAAAMLANGGLEIQPYVVERTVNPSGISSDVPHGGPGRRVLDARAVEQTARMMEEVVLGGTGKKAKVPGYRVAGKTGTAQKLDPRTGTYAEGRYVALFIGFLPAERPEIAMAVVVNEPRKGALYYGGDVAAPVFGAIARECMLYLGVPPSSGERVLTVRRGGGAAERSAAILEPAKEALQ